MCLIWCVYLKCLFIDGTDGSMDYLLNLTKTKVNYALVMS